MNSGQARSIDRFRKRGRDLSQTKFHKNQKTHNYIYIGCYIPILANPSVTLIFCIQNFPKYQCVMLYMFIRGIQYMQIHEIGMSHCSW